ncbi:hypothetical protein A2707_03285 [Candidatus Saccharibacteria bacterium RIFCSPHIGHO2_01_FULL_45_15]|nr:MAG: hypothetical protein A2707_03285 [Candidatus Saccharibacteria bacterium RIFCSPHIGHO2_01_FULL_45_15]OGL27242.1 MAG: hypothetical protein A3C39_04475 [Candidatus Saccharibacteria bacterium RIFCSPHIGHO2_02_FULL_46_12]OGL32477.1 MAG: hypothetical protein A3E76_00285 [Candidatus Saccharibacteria bacterium RIFCSPHIGHO2_12_FULL_44_22]
MFKNELNTLLTKKMDRKDFLKHVGVGVVAAVGLSSILKAVSSTGAPATSNSSANTNSSSLGYGSSAYGGTKQS